MENNIQEMNESLDLVNPRGCYSRYVVVNVKAGQVTWVETLDSAMNEKSKKGGDIFDTFHCNPELLNRALAEARKNM